MTPFKVVRLIATREITTRIRSKAYVIPLLILLASVVVTPIIIKIASSPSKPTKVAVLHDTSGMDASLQQAAAATDQKIKTIAVSTTEDGRALVHGGKASALITEQPEGSGNFEIQVNRTLNPKLKTALTVAASQRALASAIAASGGDPAVLSQATGQLHTSALNPPKTYRNDRLVLGVLIGVLIYVSILAYGQVVAQSVVEEKTSRVVELLLSAVQPWQLMAGKVLGVGVLGLTQIFLVTLVGAIVAFSLGVLSLPILSGIGVLSFGIVWYLLGFFLFASLFAAIGALVSRQEDVGSAVSPLMIFIIGPYIIGSSILPSNPGSTFVAVLSVLPFAAPQLMPMRIAIGAAVWWQVILALILTVGLLVALVGLAARIYGNAVLRTGARVPLREALRDARRPRQPAPSP